MCYIHDVFRLIQHIINAYVDKLVIHILRPKTIKIINTDDIYKRIILDFVRFYLENSWKSGIEEPL